MEQYFWLETMLIESNVIRFHWEQSNQITTEIQTIHVVELNCWWMVPVTLWNCWCYQDCKKKTEKPTIINPLHGPGTSPQTLCSHFLVDRPSLRPVLCRFLHLAAATTKNKVYE